MRKRPRSGQEKAIASSKLLMESVRPVGIVLSGGGSRAAFQIGALRALTPYLKRPSNSISVIIGSSIGAINGLLIGACLKEGIDNAIHQTEELWRERTFKNTFKGSPSAAFLRAIRMAVVQYMAPGPKPTSDAIFDPSPLMERVDSVLQAHGGLGPNSRIATLESIAVMTTAEGTKRRPLLFLSSHKKIEPEILQGASFEVFYLEELSAKHGFASAALPSVLPPVEIDTDQGKIRLVDGGISQNVPIDPAVRLGAERIISIDISGRDWWLTRYGEPHDKRPDWELLAGEHTFCMRPPETFYVRPIKPLGPLLRDCVKSSTKKFIAAVGPVWPVFSLLKNKLGEDVAYETMSYVALDPDYLSGLLEQGYNDTLTRLRDHEEPDFTVEPVS